VKLKTRKSSGRVNVNLVGGLLSVGFEVSLILPSLVGRGIGRLRTRLVLGLGTGISRRKGVAWGKVGRGSPRKLSANRSYFVGSGVGLKSGTVIECSRESLPLGWE
jgi:hypothetical protein